MRTHAYHSDRDVRLAGRQTGRLIGWLAGETLSPPPPLLPLLPLPPLTPPSKDTSFYAYMKYFYFYYLLSYI